MHKEIRIAYKILVAKPKWKRPLEDWSLAAWRILKWIWKKYVRGAGVVDWSHLAGSCVHLQVPQEVDNFLNSRVTVSFSRKNNVHRVHQSVVILYFRAILWIIACCCCSHLCSSHSCCIGISDDREYFWLHPVVRLVALLLVVHCQYNCK
jgi:hypothetical protein